MSAPKPQSVFGTTEWRSYALYNAGTRCEEAGNWAAAERLYVAALAIDASNFAARMNLGGLLVDSGSEERGIEQLVIAKHAAITERRVENDAVYYSASSRLAMALYNAGRLSEALIEAELLLKEIRKSLDAPMDLPNESRFDHWVKAAQRWPMIGRLVRMVVASTQAREMQRIQPFRRYLDQVRQTVEIIHLGLAVVAGQPVRRLLLGDAGWTPSAHYQYNLACTLSVMAARATDVNTTTQMYGDAFAHLDLALRLEPRMVFSASRDKSLADLRRAKRREFRKLLLRWAPQSSPVAATPPSNVGTTTSASAPTSAFSSPSSTQA